MDRVGVASPVDATAAPAARGPAARGPGAPDPVAAWLAQRPPLTRAQKYDRLAFTFCKIGTVALIAWVVTPPILVLAVAIVAVYLYARAVMLGITRSQCILRRPLLIMGFWAFVAVADVGWILFLR